MNKRSHITGIILAGGKSSRMGFDKCFIEQKGISLIQRTINEISALTNEIIISANSEKYSQFGHQTISDLHINIGPIGGINETLQKSSTDINIVSPCDMPFLKVELFEYLLSFCNMHTAIVPVFNDKVEPLTGIYSKKILPFIKNQITNKDYKILNLLKSANALFVPITKKQSFYSKIMFENINSKEDLKKLSLHY